MKEIICEMNHSKTNVDVVTTITVLAPYFVDSQFFVKQTDTRESFVGILFWYFAYVFSNVKFFVNCHK